MVTLGSRRIHLALTDSRGIGVHEHIVRLNNSNEYFDLMPYKGATFGQLAETAENHLKGHDFDVVYRAGGVNDIPTKDSYTEKISF